jgi:phosphopantothenoylcysteine decarboxylase
MEGAVPRRILLGVTGSVAAVKTPELYAALQAAGCEVKVAPTAPALSFFDPGDLNDSISEEGNGPGGPPLIRNPQSAHPSASRRVPGNPQSPVYLDADEWPEGRLFRVGEPVLHIELRKWADLLLIAPLDANTLAKLALGLCDNLLTCVYRAWDLSRPVVLAPAMNTLMWEHPATSRHLRQLMEDHGGSFRGRADPEALCDEINLRCPRLRIVPPQSKRLACGDEGPGGLADIQRIVLAVREMIEPRRSPADAGTRDTE